MRIRNVDDALPTGRFGGRLTLVGTCVDAFDGDGRCVVDQLPWDDVSAFACAEEDARTLTAAEFAERVSLPESLAMETQGREVRYMEADGIAMLHDLDVDVHHFFA